MFDVLTDLDYAVLEQLRLVEQRVGVKGFILWVSKSTLLKSAIPVAFLWSAWWQGPGVLGIRAARVGAAILLAVAGSLAVQQMLPVRLRPIFDPLIKDFYAGHGAGRLGVGGEASTGLGQISSMPSDHAALYGAVAFATILLHRRIGLCCLFWVVVVTCFPRVYSGFHFPSDVVVGGLIGAASAFAMMRMPLPRRVTDTVNGIGENWPRLSLGLAFMFCYLASTQFHFFQTFLR